MHTIESEKLHVHLNFKLRNGKLENEKLALQLLNSLAIVKVMCKDNLA